MKTRLLIALYFLGLASSLAMVGTTLAAPAPKCPDGFEVRMSAANDGSFSCTPRKCPDGMKVKGEVARDGSFSCIPVAAATREPPASSMAPAQYEDAKKLTLETIMAFNTDHDIGKAKAGYQNVLKLYPDYVPAHYGLGLMLEAKDDWEAARQAFQQVATNAKSEMFAEAAKERLDHIAEITESDKTPAARQRRQYDDMITQARALLDAGQLSEAAKQAIEAHDLDDSRWEAYLVAGEAAQALGLAPQAIHFYEAAEKRAPNPYKEKISRVVREESRMAEEIELWKKAESGNDKHTVETYLNRYPAGQYLEAARVKLQALKIRDLEEIKGWIKSNTRGSASWGFEDLWGVCCNNFIYQPPQVQFDGCTYMATFSYKYSSLLSRERIYEVVVDFSKIEPTFVRANTVRRKSGYIYSVEAKAGGSIKGSASYGIFKNSGSKEEPIKGEPITDSSDGDLIGQLILTRDAEHANKLADTFKKLATLCGGKSDP